METEFFPFLRSGLNGNPFRALSLSEWECVALPSLPALAWLERGGHAQFVAEAGRGKTSLVLGLCREIRERGGVAERVLLRAGDRAIRSRIPPGGILLVDEAQRLCLAERRTLARRTLRGDARLFLGTHEDLSEEFGRYGLPLQTVPSDPPDTGALSVLLDRRIRFSALKAGGHLPELSREAVEFLTGRFGGKLRELEWFLYDFFQEELPEGRIGVEWIREYWEDRGGKKIPEG